MVFVVCLLVRSRVRSCFFLVVPGPSVQDVALKLAEGMNCFYKDMG